MAEKKPRAKKAPAAKAAVVKTLPKKGSDEWVTMTANQKTGRAFALSYLTGDPNHHTTDLAEVRNAMAYVAKQLLESETNFDIVPIHQEAVDQLGIKMTKTELLNMVLERAGVGDTITAPPAETPKEEPIDVPKTSFRDKVKSAISDKAKNSIVGKWVAKANARGKSALGRVDPIPPAALSEKLESASDAAKSPIEKNKEKTFNKTIVELLKKIEKNTSGGTSDEKKTETQKKPEPKEPLKIKGFAQFGFLGIVLFGLIKLFKGLFSGLKLLASGIPGLIKGFASIARFVVGPLLNTLVGALGMIKDGLAKMLGGAWDKLQDVFSGKKPPVPTTVPGTPGSKPTGKPGVMSKLGTAMKSPVSSLARSPMAMAGGAVAVAGSAAAGYAVGTLINDTLLTNDKGEGIIGKAIYEWMHDNNDKLADASPENKARIATILEKAKKTGVISKKDAIMLGQWELPVPKGVKVAPAETVSAPRATPASVAPTDKSKIGVASSNLSTATSESKAADAAAAKTTVVAPTSNTTVNNVVGGDSRGPRIRQPVRNQDMFLDRLSQSSFAKFNAV
jgi:hypothetical protein